MPRHPTPRFRDLRESWGGSRRDGPRAGDGRAVRGGGLREARAGRQEARPRVGRSRSPPGAARTVYRGAELEKIGMPIGGICTGQLYLGGDGRLWHWDIFNQHRGTGDGHYAHPPKPDFPVEQGFASAVTSGGKTTDWPLAAGGFSDISFTGEYPIGYVEYRDPKCPVTVSLEAFSPFIPLEPDDSHLPATVMRFTVKNTSASEGRVRARRAGWRTPCACTAARRPPGSGATASSRDPELPVARLRRRGRAAGQGDRRRGRTSSSTISRRRPTRAGRSPARPSAPGRS